jgi:lipopolysaccharide biosynthesis glycosyltransferase
MNIDSNFTREMKTFLGEKTRFDLVDWNPIPDIIRTMHVRDVHDDRLTAPANYVRFYIDELFPSVNRFIYLDNDILALNSVEYLWKVDLKKNTIGLVHQCNGWFHTHVVMEKNINIHHDIFKEVFKHANHSCYPNTGVMLVDQDMFNSINVKDQIKHLILENNKTFLYQLGSQPLITLTCYNSYLPLDNKWNARASIGKTLSNSSSLIHFSGKDLKLFMCTFLYSIHENGIRSVISNQFNLVYTMDQYHWSNIAILSYERLKSLPRLKALFDLYISQIRPTMWLKKKQFATQKQKTMREQMKIHDDEFNTLKRMKMHDRQEVDVELIQQQQQHQQQHQQQQQQHRLKREQLMRQQQKELDEKISRYDVEKEISESKVASKQNKREETFVREKNNDFSGQQQMVDRASGHSAALIEHMKLMDKHIKLVTEGHINALKGYNNT